MRRRKKKTDRTGIIVAGMVVGILAVAAIITAVISSKGNSPVAPSGAGSIPQSSASVSPAESGTASAPLFTTNDYAALPLPEEMRAMWISFFEWEQADLSSAETMRAWAASTLDGCQGMGLNTVIVVVRPFGDAFYKSDLFPWSHYLTGTQGQDPGYDPLAIFIEEAHARGLRLEAWLNPYRIKSSSLGPAQLAENNPALLHPETVRDVGGNLWYDPGLPEVRQLVARGVQEIVENYDVDGIHLDDYFYPEFSPEQKEASLDKLFDAKTFVEYGSGYVLADWRRNNVNTLVADVYQRIKQVNPAVSFGISPQGNNENNYAMQYSDVKYWMTNPGYVDYVMPQLYWGFNYQTKSGRDTYAFANISGEWATCQRIDSVRLFAGLGAYRIGVGDGSSADQSEWSNGHNLADMVTHLRTVEGYSGFAFFRYEFLFTSPEELNQQERDALTGLLQGA